MTKRRKFFRNIVTVEVLSEDEPLQDGLSLAAIEESFTTGDCSAGAVNISVTEISGAEAAEGLMAQGSDPEFFRLDEDGNDLSET